MRKIRLVLAVVALLMCAFVSYGQDCHKMYDEGVSYMKSGKYEDAVRKFNSAKACDETLAELCNAKIQYCQKKMQESSSTSTYTPLNLSQVSLDFGAEATSGQVNVTGSNWRVISGTTDWCGVNVTGQTLTVKVSDNAGTDSRQTVLTISDSRQSKTLTVKQKGAAEYLSASKNSISMPASGGGEYVQISSNTKWIVGSIPSWCEVNVEESRLHVSVKPNDVAQRRTGDIRISSGTGNVTISVVQAAGQPVVANVPAISTQNDRKRFGRAVSIGITAGLVVPSFNVKASGDYLGSVVNYGYGADGEKASYKTNAGFMVGCAVDIRLYKNLYMQTGLEFVNMNMKNTFNGQYTYSANQTSTTYVSGTAYDSYNEKYSLNYIEIPALFSYRLPVGDKMFVRLEAGPYVGFGISGKMKLSGTTDWPQLIEYNDSDDSATGSTYLMNAEVSGDLSLFKGEGNLHYQYTTGNKDTTDSESSFADSPFKRLNLGIEAGAGFEIKGFTIGLAYDFPLMNVANSGYWEGQRFLMSDYGSSVNMAGYSHKISRFRLKIGYIFRW